jgi:hypothetical protein
VRFSWISLIPPGILNTLVWNCSHPAQGISQDTARCQRRWPSPGRCSRHFDRPRRTGWVALQPPEAFPLLENRINCHFPLFMFSLTKLVHTSRIWVTGQQTFLPRAVLAVCCRLNRSTLKAGVAVRGVKTAQARGRRGYWSHCAQSDTDPDWHINSDSACSSVFLLTHWNWCSFIADKTMDTNRLRCTHRVSRSWEQILGSFCSVPRDHKLPHEFKRV